MKFQLAVLALAVGLGCGGAAMAYQIEDGGITAQEVAKVLQEKGYKAEVGKDSTGDPVVKSATDGSNFTVFFYGCNHTPRCASLEFQAAFHLPKHLPADQINKWNAENRFGRAYLDGDSDPVIEMDLDVQHAFLTEGLANNVDTWAAVLPHFKKFVGFN